MPSHDTAVLVEDVHKSFGTVAALQGVSFSVPTGSILGILGPNGAGKTTTVKVLSTLIRPDKGRAVVSGHDVTEDPSAVRRSILMTGQYAALDDALTGRENLILFGRLMGLTKKAARARAHDLLVDFDLEDSADRAVRGYSGGMRRRIDIACGLVVRPDVVFLDEPTTGLDPRSRKAVWSLVDSLRTQGITTLLTTQYLEEADVLSDSIIVIDHGRVIAQGTADELKSTTGGNYCHIVPRDPADVPRAASALADLLPPNFAKSDLTADSISIPAADGPAVLAEALKRLDAAGIVLSDIGLRRPSLDDVFLSLTGQSSPAAAEADAV
ncbi:daunorubicin resistance protein DrrA family ABC transporter ATP-binding protein [Rhodococcoides trifolii]|uniref:Daunorubicin resistance protein DrrA family ABC transporter ATP-binding protein n=1 Tax=Rhodococcoides trifolii TaxID=908250 RepID=A0A917CUB5_9NOCA|nr:ATP-binding cassette domain-containing protein [Rhodococcus trifolii]GGF97305.1 daunorubicin resistance protein DrrA family ABC transporter ATP-binding protein [Rhodococcus trifolii]